MKDTLNLKDVKEITKALEFYCELDIIQELQEDSRLEWSKLLSDLESFVDYVESVKAVNLTDVSFTEESKSMLKKALEYYCSSSEDSDYIKLSYYKEMIRILNQKND
jgi:hypothetical protein